MAPYTDEKDEENNEEMDDSTLGGAYGSRVAKTVNENEHFQVRMFGTILSVYRLRNSRRVAVEQCS